ncbi:hypothetical protein IVB18_09085 [Bradyrhizobium sp. 186]|uniref:hypothetical protein n=1 Tax=Bradyrhizobium sp. 186 TaxID=2782654 RepID=UPI002001509C|nr:hypothetical protein [Bradyrhizobium sp. 186]UPK37431.1 hypothetical protein IVB18_09085 [Bradyrhizobium sp. 186]
MRKKITRDSKFHSSRLTDSKNPLGSKKVIRKKLPSAEGVSRSFTLGNNRFFMRRARVAFDHLVPRNFSVFSRVHLFRMNDPPWRETVSMIAGVKREEFARSAIIARCSAKDSG